MAIKGLAQVRKNLMLELTDKAQQRAAAAVKIGTSIIAGYATLMTPVDTSVLINSQYQDFYIQQGAVIGKVGYTAEYALRVHEAAGTLKGQARPDGSGNFWDPDAEPEFLRKAGDDNFAEIKQAVIEAMRV